MAKIQNKRIYDADVEKLKVLREEYDSIGFDTALTKEADIWCLTVFTTKSKDARPKKPEKKKRRRS